MDSIHYNTLADTIYDVVAGAFPHAIVRVTRDNPRLLRIRAVIGYSNRELEATHMLDELLLGPDKDNPKYHDYIARSLRTALVNKMEEVYRDLRNARR